MFNHNKVKSNKKLNKNSNKLKNFPQNRKKKLWKLFVIRKVIIFFIFFPRLLLVIQAMTKKKTNSESNNKWNKIKMISCWKGMIEKKNCLDILIYFHIKLHAMPFHLNYSWFSLKLSFVEGCFWIFIVGHCNIISKHVNV